MVLVLATGDENEGQRMSVPVPGRATPLVVTPVDAGSVIVPAQIPNALYVNQSAPAGGNGSAITPFQTITAALAVGVPPGATIVVFPGDYSGEGTIDLPDTSLTFFGIGNPGTDPGTGDPTGPILPAFTWTTATNPNRFAARNSTVTLAGTAAVDWTLIDCHSTSTNALFGATLHVVRGTFSGRVSGVLSDFTSVSCGDLQAGAGAPTLLANDCVFSTLMATPPAIQFRSCRFTGALNALGGSGHAFDNSSKRSFQVAGWSVDALPDDLDPSNPIFGTGTSNVVQSAGVLTVGDDQQFSNLTINATGAVQTLRAFVRVRNLLDLSGASVASLVAQFVNPGGNAAGNVGGAAGAGAGNGWIEGNAGTLGGVAGATGTVNAGTTPAASATVRYVGGGNAGGSGKGGAGVNAGGAAGAAPVAANTRVRLPGPFGVWSGPGNQGGAPESLWASQPGRAGASGGGDGAADTGGGGGGAGTGATSLTIFARGIRVDGAPAGAIVSAGPNGGNGGDGSAGGGATGGGSGAGGSGGGIVQIFFEWRIGTSDAALITAPGGTGGDGGDGANTGEGGAGGNGGDGGAIVTQNLVTMTRAITNGTAGAAGAAQAGGVGGAGGAGGTCTAALAP